MKINKFTALCFSTLFAGILFFAYQQGWLVIRLPLYSSSARTLSAADTTKKNVKLIFWHNGTWHTEYQELIWGASTEKNCLYLINTWLTLLDEENIMDKHVTLQSALAPSGQEMYLSFDRSPFQPEDTTFTKWMWIEGLLKTLRENEVKLTSVQLLVDHQPLIDQHLDFTNPWPLCGFIEK